MRWAQRQLRRRGGGCDDLDQFAETSTATKMIEDCGMMVTTEEVVLTQHDVRPAKLAYVDIR
eukprot:4438521-Heterocapsa_arctica.AAC.1